MNRKAVLIVDDEADIRELLVLTLSRMGVDADTASTFKEAQEALKTRQYSPTCACPMATASWCCASSPSSTATRRWR